MKTYFQKLYRYNQWANLGLYQHMQAIPDLPLEEMKRISHIVAAEEIWYHRIEPLGFEPLPPFEVQSWEILASKLRESAQRWLDLVDVTDNFDQNISYNNLAGESFTSELSDILIHLANHGSYHRGQIATLLRQNGYEPLPTDYILFTRA